MALLHRASLRWQLCCELKNLLGCARTGRQSRIQNAIKQGIGVCRNMAQAKNRLHPLTLAERMKGSRRDDFRVVSSI